MTQGNELLPDEMWRDLKEMHEETTSTGRNVEVVIWHRGKMTLVWAPIGRVSRHVEGGVVVETWKTLTKRDAPIFFSVVLAPGERLESHMEDCKFYGTDHGSKVVLITVNAATFGAEALYIGLLASGTAMTFSLTDWYVIGPLAALGSLIGTIWYMNRISTAKRIEIECAYPENEAPNHHVGYILHSETANVLEQLNAYDRNRTLFDSLIKDLAADISEEKASLWDRIFRLTAETKRMTTGSGDMAIRTVNKAIMTGQHEQKGPRLDWRIVAGAITLIAIAAAAIMWLR
jgi:hypothetical protein